MIEEIEISPSDRANCRVCNKTIPKGTPRGVSESTQLGRTYVTKQYYCYKCTEKILDDDGKFIIKKINFLKFNLKEMREQSKKAIILAELENGN